ncbi:MAG: homoserine dehydrogenase [Bacillota bacterium]|nr:homoserine dehydrogenase [Bacillota bacterium]
MNKINIGLLGLGTVGTGFVKTLNLNKEKIFKDLGKEIIIKKILVGNLNKKRNIDTSTYEMTDNFEDILVDEDIDIVVELLGGLSPSFEYIEKSLLKGKNVVTANKAVVATYSQELYKACGRSNSILKFEASVGGGIPIINTIKDNLVSNKIDEIMGIINGTTNFILTQMTEHNMDFKKAVVLAQEKGFAEADPSSDLEGEDAVYKLSILSNIAFEKSVSPKDIPSEGIKKINQEDIKYAEELGYNIKLLAIGDNSKEELELSVEPTFIKKSHPLSSVKNEFNGVFLRGNSIGEVMLYGKGSGGMATGSAVLSDVINIAKNNCNTNLLTDNKVEILTSSNIKHRYYIRLEVVDKAGVLGQIAQYFGDENVSIESVVQKNANGDTVPLIFITHETPKDNLIRSISKIKKFESVIGVENIIRILN